MVCAGAQLRDNCILFFHQSVSMTKAALRAEFLKCRMALAEQERSRLDDLILILFQQWYWPDQLQTVLSYWPLRERAEPNTFLLTDFMEFRIPELRLCYPVIDAKASTMEARLVDMDTDYVKNQYGIAEPKTEEVIAPIELDLVLVPLLAVDKKGYRLGYGKGFYDRYLSQVRTDCYTLGISYFEPVEEIPERDEYDLPLNGCLTPDAFYEF